MSLPNVGDLANLDSLHGLQMDRNGARRLEDVYLVTTPYRG